MSLQPPTGNKPLRASQTKENPTSIPRLAAAVPKVTAVPSLIALPPELLLIVLGNLQDIGDLFSIILTCRYILDVFSNRGTIVDRIDFLQIYPSQDRPCYL